MPTPRLQVLVCTNERSQDADRPCCSRRGGLEVYRRFKDTVRERGLREEVLITRTGCLRHCSHGIVVATWPENLWLGAMTGDDVAIVLDRLTNELKGSGAARRDDKSDDRIEELRLVDLPWE